MARRLNLAQAARRILEEGDSYLQSLSKVEMWELLQAMKREDEKLGKHADELAASPLALMLQFNEGFETARHLEYLSDRLTGCYGRGGSLLVSMPPGHAKSTVCSVWFPLWVLARHPDRLLGIVSHTYELAADWGYKVRQLVLEYGKELGLTLDRGALARDDWRTSEGGGLVAVGVGGGLVGRRLTGGLIIDDPVKDEVEASSELDRRRKVDWYETVAQTRLTPGAFTVIIGSRWHEDDLIGHLTKRSLSGEGTPFDVVNLPALAGENDPLGRTPGSPLWPEKYPLPFLQTRQRAMSSYNWNAVYQGRPTPEGGGRIKRTWWRYYRPSQCPERFDLMLQSWDLSLKAGKGRDPAVGQVWGRLGADFYLLAGARGEFDLPQVIERIRIFTQAYPRAVLKLIEDKAAGPALMQMLRRETPGVIGVNPKVGKEARVEAILPLIEGGNVFLPIGPDGEVLAWVDAFVEECAAFPLGTHDDQVDAMTQALTRLMPAGWAAQDRAGKEARQLGPDGTPARFNPEKAMEDERRRQHEEDLERFSERYNSGLGDGYLDVW